MARICDSVNGSFELVPRCPLVVGVLANQVSRPFGSYSMGQKTCGGYGSVFRSHNLSEHSSSRCVGQIAKQAFSERSFDSNGISIPVVRQRRWNITKSI